MSVVELWVNIEDYINSLPDSLYDSVATEFQLADALAAHQRRAMVSGSKECTEHFTPLKRSLTGGWWRCTAQGCKYTRTSAER